MGHLPLLCRDSPLITAERNGPLPLPLLLSRPERLLTIAVQHALSRRNIHHHSILFLPLKIFLFTSLIRIVQYSYNLCLFRNFLILYILENKNSVSLDIRSPLIYDRNRVYRTFVLYFIKNNCFLSIGSWKNDMMLVTLTKDLFS